VINATFFTDATSPSNPAALQGVPGRAFPSLGPLEFFQPTATCLELTCQAQSVRAGECPPAGHNESKSVPRFGDRGFRFAIDVADLNHRPVRDQAEIARRPKARFVGEADPSGSSDGPQAAGAATGAVETRSKYNLCGQFAACQSCGSIVARHCCCAGASRELHFLRKLLGVAGIEAK
jgi:hypothetical protein